MNPVRAGLGLAGLAAFLMFLAGCGLFSSQEKPYRGCFWPADVELAKGHELSDVEQAMTASFCDVDRELERLLARLRAQEEAPDGLWMEALARELAWLNGVFYATESGRVIRRHPEHPIKQLDPADLLPGIDRDGRRGLRYRVQENALGRELALIKPIYSGLSRQGYLVAHFDLRSILRFTSNPERIALLSPKKVLWPGKIAESSQLASLDWPDILEEAINDTVEINGKQFYWLARYVGRDPLIYVVEIPKES